MGTGCSITGKFGNAEQRKAAGGGMSKLSLNDSAINFPLTDVEVLLIKTTFRDPVLALRPDLFHRTWVRAIKKSLRMNEIIALGNFCFRDLTKWPKLHWLAQSVQLFFEGLVYDLNMNPLLVAERSRKLGEDHVNYSQFGFQPVYWDIFVSCLVDVLETLALEDEEQKKSLALAWSKFGRFIADQMMRGYKAIRSVQMVANQKQSDLPPLIPSQTNHHVAQG